MRRILVISLIGAFVLLTLPVREFLMAAPKGNGALAGFIFGEDMRTPVRDAVVKLRNIESQKEYKSDPTASDGTYVIPGIEEGRYVMGVIGPRGSYNFHYSIMIKADSLAKLSVAMKPGGAPVMVEAGNQPWQKKPTIIDFFKSPAGLLTLITAVEVTLFAIVLSEGEASPVIID